MSDESVAETEHGQFDDLDDLDDEKREEVLEAVDEQLAPQDGGMGPWMVSFSLEGVNKSTFSSAPIMKKWDMEQMVETLEEKEHVHSIQVMEHA